MKKLLPFLLALTVPCLAAQFPRPVMVNSNGVLTTPTAAQFIAANPTLAGTNSAEAAMGVAVLASNLAERARADATNATYGAWRQMTATGLSNAVAQAGIAGGGGAITGGYVSAITIGGGVQRSNVVALGLGALATQRLDPTNNVVFNDVSATIVRLGGEASPLFLAESDDPTHVYFQWLNDGTHDYLANLGDIPGGTASFLNSNRVAFVSYTGNTNFISVVGAGTTAANGLYTWCSGFDFLGDASNIGAYTNVTGWKIGLYTGVPCMCAGIPSLSSEYTANGAGWSLSYTWANDTADDPAPNIVAFGTPVIKTSTGTLLFDPAELGGYVPTNGGTAQNLNLLYPVAQGKFSYWGHTTITGNSASNTAFSYYDNTHTNLERVSVYPDGFRINERQTNTNNWPAATTAGMATNATTAAQLAAGATLTNVTVVGTVVLPTLLLTNLEYISRQTIAGTNYLFYHDATGTNWNWPLVQP